MSWAVSNRHKLPSSNVEGLHLPEFGKIPAGLPSGTFGFSLQAKPEFSPKSFQAVSLGSLKPKEPSGKPMGFNKNRKGLLGTPLIFGWAVANRIGKFYAGVILYFHVSVMRRSE